MDHGWAARTYSRYSVLAWQQIWWPGLGVGNVFFCWLMSCLLARLLACLALPFKVVLLLTCRFSLLTLSGPRRP